MKKILFISIFSFCLFSCSSDFEKVDENNVARIDFSKIQMCTEMHLIEDSLMNTRAMMYRSKVWNEGQIIKVKFLNGNVYLQEKVKKYVNVWLEHANLNIRWEAASSQNADIKVAFKWNGDSGSWSYIGTDCRKIGQQEPSMNFGWFEEWTSEEEFSRVILHEFGHALGLVHEHQHPYANIPWNKPVVYEYYARQGWDKAQVDHNIFRAYGRTEVGSVASYDKNSIMHYWISPSLIIGDYASYTTNVELSSGDKLRVKNFYP